MRILFISIGWLFASAIVQAENQAFIANPEGLKYLSEGELYIHCRTLPEHLQNDRKEQKKIYQCTDADQQWADNKTKQSNARQDEGIKKSVITFIKEYATSTPGDDNTYTDKRGNTFTYNSKTNTVKYTLTNQTLHNGQHPSLSSFNSSGTLQSLKDFKQWEDFIKFDSQPNKLK